MIIRAAAERDAQAVTDLVNNLVRNTTVTFTSDPKTVEETVASIRERADAFFVAEVDGAVVGFATLFPFRHGPGYGWTKEHSIVLAPAARGRGVGRALMSMLEDAARSAGVHNLVAGVSAENTAGIAFHTAIGFEEVGRLPEVGRKFDRWLDLVRMQKRL